MFFYTFNVFVRAKQGRQWQGFVCMWFQVPNPGSSADKIRHCAFGQNPHSV